MKISTPYGEKNWEMIKNCLDNHENLLETCKKALDYIENNYDQPLSFDDIGGILEQAINKAERRII